MKQFDDIEAWIAANPLRKWRVKQVLPHEGNRKHSKMTQAFVAFQMQVTAQTVKEWESGRNRPSDANIVKLERLTEIKTLGKKWDDWFEARPAILQAV